MARDGKVTLLMPGSRLKREVSVGKVGDVLTALHYLQKHFSIGLGELYWHCLRGAELPYGVGFRLVEEGLLMSFDRRTKKARLDPEVRAIVLAAVTYQAPGSYHVARSVREIGRQ